MQIIDSVSLVPHEWRALAACGPIYVFNPSITEFRQRKLIAYRVVLSDRRRRIAIAALNQNNQVIPESIVALSNHLPNTRHWHADPRFCCMGDRLYLHFNNGGTAHNDIYLVELDPNSLRPCGPTRPLHLEGPRQVIEKNWMLFSPNPDTLLAVYGILPHVILRLDLSTPERVHCVRQHCTEWALPSVTPGFQQPRGGTPPVRVGDTWFSFFHVLKPASILRRLNHRLQYRGGRPLHSYQMGFYGFSAFPPFQPTCFTPAPICVVPRRLRTGLPALNRDTERVLYPAGALFKDGRWSVSAGLNDEHATLLTFDHDTLMRATIHLT